MKLIAGLCLCLFVSTSVFAQEETVDIAPSQAPTNSVIDNTLTLDAQENTSAVQIDGDAPTLIAPGIADLTNQANQPVIQDQTIQQIPSTLPVQQNCGCQQTSYTAQPVIVPRTYSNQVYTGNTFNRVPTQQQQQVYRTYNVPQANVYTSVQRQYVPQQTQQYQIRQQYYYAPQQQAQPLLRRGLFFNRFRR